LSRVPSLTVLPLGMDMDLSTLLGLQFFRPLWRSMPPDFLAISVSLRCAPVGALMRQFLQRTLI
jgi:hypothetical protein